MKVAAQIRNALESIPESQPFGYDDLGIERADFVAAAKALERLQKKGTIKKILKGIFYKPKMTIMGPLGPDYDGLLNRFLFKNEKRVGYVTGGELYNQLNLTTQNYFRKKIATNISRKRIEKGWLKTSTVKSYVEITDENYPLLGLLDVIKDIKNISDTSAAQAVIILSAKIKKFDSRDIQSLIEYAFQYPPRVRALLGAILEAIFLQAFELDALKKSLNPTTIFKIGIKETDLPTINNWKIK